MRLPALFRRRVTDAAAAGEEKALSTISSRGGWWPIFESFAGAWQQNVVVDRDSVLANPYVFRCQSMIARDIAKLRVRLVGKDGDVWKEQVNPAYSPVLRKPNGYQTRNQFWEAWMLCKLSRGNTYVLKVRDLRGVVVALHVLDPLRVNTLVSDQGDVFYDLLTDNLAGLPSKLTVPAREIIHDRWNCLYHPLVGLSPIWAIGLAAMQAQKISENAVTFFANQARPGGMLTAPGKINQDTAERLKETFAANFSGANSGKLAVAGDGLKFEPFATKATDAQLVEQLKWTGETIAMIYGIPLQKLGLAQIPAGETVQGANIRYYVDALQSLIEDAETCLDEGLGLDGVTIGTEFDTDNLWRMDSVAQMQVLEQARSVMTLDERRARLNMPTIKGGATIYLQQQDHSLEAIAARDQQMIEAAKNPPAVAPVAPPPGTAEGEDDGAADAEERAFVAETLLSLRKALEAA